MSDLPKANDFAMTDLGPMIFSHWIGHAVAESMKARGVWRTEETPLVIVDRLRDMAAISKAVIEAMHSWPGVSREDI